MGSEFVPYESGRSLRREKARSEMALPFAYFAEIKTGEKWGTEFFISPFVKYVDELLTLR